MFVLVINSNNNIDDDANDLKMYLEKLLKEANEIIVRANSGTGALCGVNKCT